MDLKERFENFESMPDEGVWKNVQKGLRRRKMMRYSAMAALLSALSVAAIIAFWPAPAPVSTSPMVTEQVAVVLQPEQERVSPSEVMPQPSQQVTARVQAEKVSEHVVAIEKEEIQPLVSTRATEEATMQKSAVIPHVGTETNVATQEHVVVPATKETESVVEPLSQSELTENEAEGETMPSQPDGKLMDVQQPYEVMVWVPNAFAPDDPAGGEVSLFKAVAKERAHLKSFKMYIYNRAGALVFQSTHVDEAWDGTHRGEKCPSGNYVYIIELNDEYAGLQHTRGSVLLIR